MMGMIDNEMQLHLETTKKSIDEIQSYIYTVFVIVTDTKAHGNRVFMCSDDKSTAITQHIANCNDFEMVFDTEVEDLFCEGDLLIGISTDGNSQNVNNLLASAKELGCRTIGFSGLDGGGMNDLCDVNIIVPSDNTPRIQEMHILIGHILCQAIDDIS